MNRAGAQLLGHPRWHLNEQRGRGEFVDLENARSTMEILDRRQVTLAGRRRQFLSGKGVRDVLE